MSLRSIPVLLLWFDKQCLRPCSQPFVSVNVCEEACKLPVRLCNVLTSNVFLLYLDFVDYKLDNIYEKKFTCFKFFVVRTTALKQHI